VGDKVHSHDSNCIYSVVKSNGDSIEFSLSIAEQRAVGFILAWSLAFLQCKNDVRYDVVTLYKRLGKISDILRLNNKNNQLERRVRPPRDIY